MGARRGRVRSRSSGARSRAGSRSSTPPTSTTAARARSSPDACCRGSSACARSTSSRRRCACGRCPARTASGSRASTSSPRSTRRCSGSASTTSTSTRSTAGIPVTPIEETMEALHDVVKAGKARYIGASSMYAWQFAKAQSVARDAVRLDAEPLQPRLPRGGAGDDPAVPRPGRRACCPGARSRADCSPATGRARARS